MLDEFVSALNDLIEGAKTHAQDPEAFLAFNKQIGALVETGLPPLADALATGELDADDRARLVDSLAAIRDLEAKARARLVWSRDFEDYMRQALSGDG